MTKEKALKELAGMVDEPRVYDRAEHPELCWSSTLRDKKWVGGLLLGEDVFGNGDTWEAALAELRSKL